MQSHHLYILASLTDLLRNKLFVHTIRATIEKAGMFYYLNYILPLLIFSNTSEKQLEATFCKKKMNIEFTNIKQVLK